MRPRIFAISLIGIGGFLFTVVAAVNFILDPFNVFETKLVSYHRTNGNDRYRRFLEYQADAEKVQGLMFASSRGNRIPVEELSRLSGIRFASFAVTAGMITDHLPMLEYALREKARRGQRLRSVFLFLDLDVIGVRPNTNRVYHAMLPPALTGESRARFFWRYLTAIQFRTWRVTIQDLLRQRRAEQPLGTTAQPNDGWRILALLRPSAAHAQELPEPGRPILRETLALRLVNSVHYAQHLELLRRFVDLCRENGVELKVAVTPLRRERVAEFFESELRQVLADLIRVVPIWDFAFERAVAENQEYWLGDGDYFTAAVGGMIVRRLLGEDLPPPWSAFGQLRTQ
jgi:hypothetical protein